MVESLVDPLWWILIDKETLGPFSFIELERDTRLTPDTYVWKEGMEKWQRARDVLELEKLFKDPKGLEETSTPLEVTPEDDELIIDTRLPPYWWAPWWIIALMAIVTFYVWIKL